MNYYQRGGMFSNIPPVTKIFLIINIVIFGLGFLLAGMGYRDAIPGVSFLNYQFGLHNLGTEQFSPVQLIAHMFLHGNLSHLFFNMFGLFMFGRLVEMRIESKNFFIFYFVAGIGAALLNLGINYFQFNDFIAPFNEFLADPNPEKFEMLLKMKNIVPKPDHFTLASQWVENPGNLSLREHAIHVVNMSIEGFSENHGHHVMVGASGAIFGILAAFAMLFPNVELMLIFLPVPIKAKYFVPIYAVIELTMGVANFQWDNIAHWAHLGGALFGFLYIYFWKRNQFKPI